MPNKIAWYLRPPLNNSQIFSFFMAVDSSTTPTMRDSSGHVWNVHQPSLDAVRAVLSHIVASINGRKDLTGDQKHDMITHLSGLNHADMAQAVMALQK